MEDIIHPTFSLEITGHDFAKDDRNKDFCEFILSVKTAGKSWEMRKRFSQLLDLHRGLVDRFKSKVPDKFPPRYIYHTQEDWEKRKQQFSDYIKALMEVPEIVESWELNLFLEVDSHMKPAGWTGLRVLIPLPDNDFDPTEVAVPWKILTLRGIQVFFATEKGKKPQCDELQIRPEGVLFGQMGADWEAKKFYREMESDANFCSPVEWNSDFTTYDALYLPGGHAPRMKPYLESLILQKKILEFWKTKKPIGAICHGVLLLGRTKKEDGRSVIYEKKITTLPRYMEMAAYQVTRWKYGNLYRTYDVACEDEVRSFLENSKSQFNVGPTNYVSKGSLFDDIEAFTVLDDNLVTGRWPGDAYKIGKQIVTLLTGKN